MDKLQLIENIKKIEQSLQPFAATITENVVAISKKKSADSMELCYNLKLRKFGENYVQELLKKYEQLKDICPEIEWHFTGHLQTNKVKYIAPFIHTIQTVDSLKLAKEISKEARKHQRTISIFVQVNTSQEDTKSGVSPTETIQLVKDISLLPSITVDGLMTIPSVLDENEEDLRNEFRTLVRLQKQIHQELSIPIRHLSMGMTHDYLIALEESATLVRIGTGIFGDRM